MGVNYLCWAKASTIFLAKAILSSPCNGYFIQSCVYFCAGDYMLKTIEKLLLWAISYGFHIHRDLKWHDYQVISLLLKGKRKLKKNNKKSVNIKFIKKDILSKRSMDLVHQLNMKKQVHCRKDWLSILPPHKIISYRTTITPCNKKMIFRIGRSQCPNIPRWQETMRNAWKFRSSHPYKSICFEYFGNILGHDPWWDLILIKFRNEELKIYENSTSPRVFSW